MSKEIVVEVSERYQKLREYCDSRGKTDICYYPLSCFTISIVGERILKNPHPCEEDKCPILNPTKKEAQTKIEEASYKFGGCIYKQAVP